MKKTIALIVSASIFSAVYAQDIPKKAVPAVVQNAFQQRFKKVLAQEWELKGDLYQVEFKVGLTNHEAWITSAGKMMKHEQDISASQLPEAAKAHIKKAYAGYRIDDADKIEENGAVTYEVEIEAGQVERQLVFNAEGILLTDRKS